MLTVVTGCSRNGLYRTRHAFPAEQLALVAARSGESRLTPRTAAPFRHRDTALDSQ